MYEPQAVFEVFRGNMLPIFSLLAIAMVGNTLFFIEGIRLGFRDRSYASSAICTLLFFAHDLSFVLDFPKWFFEYDFWVWKALWINILISLLGECVFFYQMIRYGRHELFPGLSAGAAVALLLLAQVGTCVGFFYVKALIGDPLYLLTIPFTIFWLAPFAIGLTLHRGSRRGQSILLNVTYILMVVGLWPAWMLLQIDFFRTPLFLALGAVTVLWSLANCAVLLRQPPYVGGAGAVR
jgi:hypothetical protein